MNFNMKAIERRIRLWNNGHPFPPGFDDWCERESPHPNLRQEFREHDHFAAFEKRYDTLEVGRAIEPFISSVTKPGTHWLNVHLNPSAHYQYAELKIEFPEERIDNAIDTGNTHIWALNVGGPYKLLECTNLRVKHFVFNVGCKVRLVGCVIGKLIIAIQAPNIDLEIDGCLIGTLEVRSSTVKRLKVVGGGIACWQCPPSEKENPFTGDVSIHNLFLPFTKTQTKLFPGPHIYRVLYAHLKNLDNTLMANLIRADQLRAERAEEHRLAKVVNWIYGTFVYYGVRPSRPLLWLCAGYVFTFLYCYLFDDGIVTQTPNNSYVGAYALLLDEHGGHLTRSLLLPLHSIVNPFGILFDSRRLFIPSTGLGSVLLTLQGLFSDMLLVMIALAIKRRYKAE